MVKDSYNIPELYRMLKLGLFKSGKITKRGYLSSGTINECFLRKPLNEYNEQIYAKKQLAIGLYLLDLFQLAIDKNNKATYILVICVCRTNLNYKEKIYVLRLSHIPLGTDIIALISGEIVIRKYKSVFRKKLGRSFFDASPLNSVSRKH